MSFKIAARTILHLGAELISSDGIALYELIKNAYDAGSRNVKIDITMTLSRTAQRDVMRAAASSGTMGAPQMRTLRDRCLVNLVEGAPQVEKLRAKIASSTSLEDLLEIVQEANRLSVTDNGGGMTITTLNDAFLTIGTRSKQSLKRLETGNEDHTILGEKGIGRLSAMRLGSRLQVRTATKTDAFWNMLDIDWSVFDHDSDMLVGDVPLTPYLGDQREATDSVGTSISIRGLHRDWSLAHVEEIAQVDFARINDPFEQSTRFPIILTYNGDSIRIPRIEPWIFEHSHGKMECFFQLSAQGAPTLSGTTSYRGKLEAFSLRPVDLMSLSGSAGPDVLRSLGPFSMQLYYFNRAKLTALEGVGDLTEVRKRLAAWSGGLMLYRDGFRVLPYGGQDDDWLGLDQKALARGGFKLNRQQIVGRVLISSRRNPSLRDQANREGLVDSDEKRALVSMLAYLVQQTMWSFMNKVEKADRPPREPVREDVIDDRLAQEENRLERNIALLMSRVPAVHQERQAVAEIRAGVASLIDTMTDVRHLAKDYEEGRTQLLNLAGIGLAVEIIAHELNRTTETAIIMLERISLSELSASADASLRGLAAQLKTLQKRLRSLDPLSTTGRNRKEKVALAPLLKDILESHADHFQREGIESSLLVLPVDTSKLVITMVRGMIIQVLENLISNSVYWLQHARRLDPAFHPRIDIVLDTDTREVRYTDNGPGIAEADREKVFEAFYTKKPAGGGKGLGLFISSEIMKYHGAQLSLEPGEDGDLRTFVLDLRGVK